jgi:hypothetical protein
MILPDRFHVNLQINIQWNSALSLVLIKDQRLQATILNDEIKGSTDVVKLIIFFKKSKAFSYCKESSISK